MRTARAMAQAKVNLLLRVGPPESSGYHGIRTIYQRVDLADELVVRVGGSVRALDVTGPHVPDGGLGPPETNLAYRAAVAYAERTGWPRGFSVELTKNIPVGGGLGGGSADAGAVLRTLNALATRSLDSDELAEIAGSLGADVPFLTLDHPLALGQGRGDLLAVLEPLPVRDVLLAVPHFAIATADAYRWLDEGAAGTMTPLPIPADHVVIGMTGTETWDSIRGLSHNDFEAVVEQRHPELRELRQRLDASGARIARLSGSGSTVFGVFDGAAPDPRDLALDALVIPTRTSARVVQVEVLE